MVAYGDVKIPTDLIPRVPSLGHGEAFPGAGIWKFPAREKYEEEYEKISR